MYKYSIRVLLYFVKQLLSILVAHLHKLYRKVILESLYNVQILSLLKVYTGNLVYLSYHLRCPEI